MFGMKAHLIDTHLLNTKVKVIFKGQGQISGSCLSKDGYFRGGGERGGGPRALVFHKHILFLQVLTRYMENKDFVS